MTTDFWVIRLARSDQVEQPILVRITKKPNGHPLDLDLLATDGFSAFRTKLRNRKLDKLRSVGYEGSSEEWSSILQYVFLPSISTDLHDSLRNTLDVVCNISETAERLRLDITIRQSVEGITHKFGVVELNRTEDSDDVDLFGWTAQTAKARDSLARELQESNINSKRSEETIMSLRQQLDSLIAAKEEHEKQLLSKCAVLLNEKKLRIRSQQRQIAQRGSHSTSPGEKRSQPKSLRKRKHDDSHESAPTISSESDGFDNMDIDEDKSTDEQGSEDDRETSKDTESGPEPERPQPTVPSSSKSISADTDALPPPRELPFAKHAAGATVNEFVPKATAGVDLDAEATASEEDEL